MLTNISGIYKKPFMGIEKGYIPIIDEDEEKNLLFAPAESGDMRSDRYVIHKEGWCPFKSPNGSSYLKDVETNYSENQEKYLEKYPDGFHIYKDKKDAIRLLELLEVEKIKVAKVEYTCAIARGYDWLHIEDFFTYRKARVEVALLVRVLDVTREV